MAGQAAPDAAREAPLQPPLDLVTWGETMLRLAPPVGVALEGAASLEVCTGGTESNLAIALARLGRRVGWLSRLPEGPLGRRIAREIAAHGVDTSRVLWAQEGRAGLVFMETGLAPRPNLVLYDRAQSAVALLDPAALDYAYLSSARVLSLSGITPALSANCREAWLRSAQAAHGAGRRVLLDVNYRAKLWSPQQARTCLEQVFPYCAAMVCSFSDARLLFSAPEDPALAAEALRQAYHVPLVVLTLGEHGALAHDGQVYRHPIFPTQVLDRIGAGDAFAAGFVHGWLEGDLPRALRYGCALAALKQTYRGDTTWSTQEDLEDLVAGGEVDARKVRR